jgi:hypothetical protein
MDFRQFYSVGILVIAMVLSTFSAVAEEGHAEASEHSSGTESHGETSHHFKNAFALFLGATNEHGHGTEPTWGLEYGRALTPHWTIGGLIDYAGGAQRNVVIAPMVVWKPFAGGGFVLLAAPGVEYHNGRGTLEHHLSKAETAAVDKDETYFVLRLGTAYYFHLGSRFGIGPTVNLDLVEGEQVWVYGVNLEVMF